VGLRLYSALIHAARAAAWPVLWWLGRRVPAFRERWAERRGHAGLPDSARHGVVVHAASMGEVGAAEPLVRALLAARPDLPLVLTCTTPTASARIRETFGDAVHHVYLPFDTPGAVRRFLDDLAPRALVVLETELWPNLLTAAQARGCVVVLANGRLSARSAARYARFRRTTHQLLAAVDVLLLQDAAVRERFLALGAAPARTQVTGSLKFDTPLPPGHDARLAQFRAWVGGRPVWVAASTHEGEEAAVLAAHAQLRVAHPDWLLVLVPRHPQRFDAVAGLIADSGLGYQRRTAARAVAPETAVLLADSMGELTAWLAAAQAVFIGGTLVPVGGHNPLEAMQFGAPLLAGPQVFNFAQVFAELAEADALYRVDDASSLAQALSGVAADPAAAQARGDRGRVLHGRHGGATGRTVAPLLALLDGRAGRAEAPLPDGVAWVDPALVSGSPAALFDPTAGTAREGASGRGMVWFVSSAGHELVRRHYRRGGLVGRLIADRYLREPLAQTRAMAEFALLQRLVGWGLAVPRAAAARWQAAGPFYRADILVERLAGAEDLSEQLQVAPLPAEAWQAVGAAIARLHAHGVFHSDLNCHNLMRDPAGQVWIIDFDKCAVRAAGPWQPANLERLRRSLRKERGRLPSWHWDEADWPALMAGYDGRA
jgi:3-deoxy-D-manno-octulosonic-acid transferase